MANVDISCSILLETLNIVQNVWKSLLYHSTFVTNFQIIILIHNSDNHTYTRIDTHTYTLLFITLMTTI